MADYKVYRDQKFLLPRRYKLIKVLGSGSYGVVCSVVDTKARDQCVELAVKKVGRIFKDPILMRRAIRELRLMRFLRGHRNIVSLIDVQMVTMEAYAGVYCYQELMDWDLNDVLVSRMELSEFHIQHLVYQILKGLMYTHSANIIHRDLKPGNILINRSGTIKIADFGLARGITSAPAASSPITNHVATRYYRAPELLFLETKYGKEVDMWAVGCILGEMYGRRPMMAGKDSLGQLVKIIEMLGQPTKKLLRIRGWLIPSELKKIRVEDSIEKSSARLARINKKRYGKLYPFASEDAIELLDSLIRWDPKARLTVEQAIESPFFHSVRSVPGESTAPGIFEFGAEEEIEHLDELSQMLYNEVEEFQAQRVAEETLVRSPRRQIEKVETEGSSARLRMTGNV
ncbi:hypothetical protein CJJ07_003543 [Candidozyma auris]|nr:hypothetical protein CJJ07_003543 [[Candida] auris]QEL59432.1 hypothetical protein CJJ09_001510 [[Candida] auris]